MPENTENTHNQGLPRFINAEKSIAKLTVVGVGGAGGNVVNRMIETGVQGVKFVAVNTDQQDLENNLAETKLSIGQKLTEGLGAGAIPEQGKLAAEEDREAIANMLKGADMVFITAGMGGGTGTGAAPVIAQIARDLGILTVGVVTKPFSFEGPIRARHANAGLDEIRSHLDTNIVVENNKILEISDENTSVTEALSLVDEVLINAVRGISDIITNHGTIQVDFKDVQTIMKNSGSAIMGIGLAEGENRALEAAKKAINSPLLESVDISGASGVLVNVCGGSDLGILELTRVMNYVNEAVGQEKESNVIFGTAIKEELNSKIEVTVIATGFQRNLAGTQITPTPVEEKDMVEVPVVNQYEEVEDQFEDMDVQYEEVEDYSSAPISEDVSSFSETTLDDLNSEISPEMENQRGIDLVDPPQPPGPSFGGVRDDLSDFGFDNNSSEFHQSDYIQPDQLDNDFYSDRNDYTNDNFQREPVSNSIIEPESSSREACFKELSSVDILEREYEVEEYTISDAVKHVTQEVELTRDENPLFEIYEEKEYDGSEVESMSLEEVTLQLNSNPSDVEKKNEVCVDQEQVKAEIVDTIDFLYPRSIEGNNPAINQVTTCGVGVATVQKTGENKIINKKQEITKKDDKNKFSKPIDIDSPAFERIDVPGLQRPTFFDD